MVHHKKRFNVVKLSFPIRGHSYMECDRDMSVVNQKLPVNTPAEWQQHFREARRNPSPFNVIPVHNPMLLNVDKLAHWKLLCGYLSSENTNST